MERLKEVTPADVARVAEEYLTEKNRTVGWIVREPADAGTQAAQGGGAQ